MKTGTNFLSNRLHWQSPILWRWQVRALGIIVALELGLLSPLSCVIHCLVQPWIYERTAPPTFFLCDLHRDDPSANNAPLLLHVHPRAVYEALPSLWVAVLLVVPLILLLALRYPALRRTSPLPPPTPPPRMFSLHLLFPSLPVKNVKAVSAMQR